MAVFVSALVKISHTTAGFISLMEHFIFYYTENERRKKWSHISEYTRNRNILVYWVLSTQCVCEGNIGLGLIGLRGSGDDDTQILTHWLRWYKLWKLIYLVLLSLAFLAATKIHTWQTQSGPARGKPLMRLRLLHLHFTPHYFVCLLIVSDLYF